MAVSQKTIYKIYIYIKEAEASMTAVETVI